MWLQSYQFNENADTGQEKQTSCKGQKYIYIGNKIANNNKKLVIGQAILLNPNIYENINKNLLELKSNLKIETKREWTLLGCNSPPFCIAHRLIEQNPEKYNWVSLVRALCHLNMNLVKTFFKIVDKICLDASGKEALNSQYSKAYHYLLNCKNTHKAWQSIEVLLHGTIQEMIKLYLSESKEQPSVLKFFTVNC